jgi:RimJ/RimL family protein N-acetyltransferase
MDAKLFHGSLVRLAPIDPQEFSKAASAWGRQSDYWRLMTSVPPELFSAKATQTWIEKNLENKTGYSFAIRTLADDRLIGSIELDGIQWVQGDTFVGISIGEKDCWGKGYGTDAMHVILRFAFLELNLHRVSLDVFDYNPRAIRSYEKAGFVHEGRLRQFLNKEGQRYDLIFMGILRDEWLTANPI